VKVIDYFRDDFSHRIYQVIEFIDGYEILNGVGLKDLYKEIDACQHFMQILEGLKYLHSLCVCHRDIKP
jgi:5'-AMP-activated protein kinase catalytic alpha subunit